MNAALAINMLSLKVTCNRKSKVSGLDRSNNDNALKICAGRLKIGKLRGWLFVLLCLTLMSDGFFFLSWPPGSHRPVVFLLVLPLAYLTDKACVYCFKP